MIEQLPEWCHSIRADNPGPMTLDGTNTYLLRAAGANVVVDPGPLLAAHLADIVAAAGPVSLVLITHHHDDHVGGAARLRELTGAAVAARDPRLCAGGVSLPADGSVLDLPGLDVRVIDTPGHTADSVCFLADDGTTRVLFSGDTVLGRGTTVVSYPDGNLSAYLDSLQRLREAVGERCLLLPGHGPARAGAGTVISEYLAHRYERIDQVRAALAAGARTAHDVVEIVYADVDRSVWPAAERTVRATLDHLGAGSDPAD